ncbi:MAG: Flp family type IVb pilin [Verrucomicrobiota bacterium]
MKKIREKGQSLTEYGLIIALLGVLLTTALLFMKNAISNTFSQSASSIKSATD